MTRICPHCKQPIPQPRRVVRSCYDCKAPIRRHDKWSWAERGEGILTSVHRHCDNPQGYGPAEAETPPKAPLFDGGAS